MDESFGQLLRRWRVARGFSQLGLAGHADTSTRHLSFMETGRALPSRALLLRLAERLSLPLRERNAWLVAAGYAPMYPARRLDDPALAAAKAAVQRVLSAHEPFPALAVDRHWHLVLANRAVDALLAGIDRAVLAPPLNVLRLSLHPQGLAPHIVNFAAWRHHLLARLQAQALATADPVLADLLHELQHLPPPGKAPVGAADGTPATAARSAAGPAAEHPSDPAADEPPGLALPLVLDTPMGRLSFLTTVTVFGTPTEVSLQELAIETLLPADEFTAQALRALAGAPATPSAAT